MESINYKNITADPANLPVFAEKKITVEVLRLDNIHPFISGNKWFKLRHYLDSAREENKNHIITFGGAWSNHLLATAAACQLHQFQSSGIVRGEKPATPSPTLIQVQKMGMQIFFTDRPQYHEKIVPQEVDQTNAYIIPEGGYGINGAAGAKEILDHCEKEKYTHILCAVGTGTMIAGLVNTAMPHQTITGVSVLKGNHELEANIRALLLTDRSNFSLVHDYHFGGYAKYNDTLINFMNDWYRQTGIPSDFVYTAKLFYAVVHLSGLNYFPAGSRVLLIHSGGLQGNASLSKGTLIF